MDAERSIGQRLITGFDGTEVTEELREAVKRCGIGNFILFRRNIMSGGQLQALCAGLWDLVEAETGLPPLIMTDEEGGSVSRLAGIAGETPCAMAVSETGKPENAWKIGSIIGQRLRAAGVNMNLAPVLDLFTDKANFSHGNRCFGSDPHMAGCYAGEYIRGLHEQGILCVGKHFPGVGDTSVDSHLALPVVDKPRESFEQLELIPFRKAMREGVDAIMSAHIMLPAYEKERVPATVSRSILTDLLRGELGYGGLLMTDSMEMHGVLDLFPVDEGTLRALNAGADMGMICHDLNMTRHVHGYLMEALNAGHMDAQDMHEHVERIVRFKQRLRRPDTDGHAFWTPEQERVVREIMGEAVQLFHCPEGQPLPVIGPDTVYAGYDAALISQAGDTSSLCGAQVLSRMLGGRWAGPEPALEQLMAAPVCVMVIWRTEDSLHLADMAEAMLENGKQVIVISMHVRERLRDFPDGAFKMAAWQYDRMSLEVLAEAMKRMFLRA